MKELKVSNSFFEIFPEGKIFTIEASGINNSKRDEDKFNQLLNEAAKTGKQLCPDPEFSQNTIIKQWRQAYQQFKTKKGTRASIEALLKRACQGKEFNSINPLVDIYNCVSLTYGVPCGAEDLDKIEGDFILGVAKGGEEFLPLGADKDSPALEGEVIYHDDKGAICRCLNWREAQRTMVEPETENVILVIEAVYKEQYEQSEKAALKLKEEVENYFGIEAKLNTISK